GAVFSLVDAFLFRPLPVDSPEQLVVVGERPESQPPGAGFLATSLVNFRDLRERSRLIEAWGAMQPRTMSLRGTEGAEAVSGMSVTPSFFGMLGATLHRGRAFEVHEAVEGGPALAILGHEFWLERYGESINPLGEVLILNGEAHEIVGITPPNFAFLTPTPDIWTPLATSAVDAERDERTVIALGRFPPTTSTEQVREEMNTIGAQLAAEFSETQRGWAFDTYNARYDIPTRQTRVLFGLLQGSVFLVLLIACVNITNLLMARGQERRREIALRTVLGAHRGRIVRQLLTESSILVAGGMLLAAVLGITGIRAIANQFAGVLPPGFEIQMNTRVVLFMLAASAASGLAFGLAPALETFRRGQATTLREGDVRGGGGRKRKRLSRALVVAEIALSFVALGGGTMLVRSFLEIQGQSTGFDISNLLTASMTLPASKQPDDQTRVQVREEALDRMRRIPGVQQAAFVSVLPQSSFGAADTFRVEGRAVDPGTPAPRTTLVQASSGYLQTMGIGLIQGRFFAEEDREDGLPVAVISEALRTAEFPAGDALGARVLIRGETRTVVGVVDDVPQTFLQTPGTSAESAVYVPMHQMPAGASTIVLRTSGDPRSAADPLRRTLQQLDPDLSLSGVLTWDEYINQFLVGIQVFNVVLGGFGIVALLLAALGTYGVLSYSVNQRRREIGIRMTVGAKPRGIVRMMARQGFFLAVVGLGVGVLLTLPLIGLMQGLLAGFATVKPTSLTLIAVVLFAVTMVATLVPAARAAMVDPVSTLRDG
ncbi:MAG: ABC transporter permease, partial [Gemmatimonadota bacterium]|nr:ABC transporter permease [Gemmatimonadota bacterium]